MLDILRYYLNLLAVKTGKGQGLVEYALIIVLVSIACIGALQLLAGGLNGVFSSITSTLGS